MAIENYPGFGRFRPAQQSPESRLHLEVVSMGNEKRGSCNVCQEFPRRDAGRVAISRDTENRDAERNSDADRIIVVVAEVDQCRQVRVARQCLDRAWIIAVSVGQYRNSHSRMPKLPRLSPGGMQGVARGERPAQATAIAASRSPAGASFRPGSSG